MSKVGTSLVNKMRYRDTMIAMIQKLFETCLNDEVICQVTTDVPAWVGPVSLGSSTVTQIAGLVSRTLQRKIANHSPAVENKQWSGR